MQKENQNTQTVVKHRVIAMLDRQELDFLDKLGKDALFSTGHKLSYNKILKSLVDFAMEMENIKEKLMEIAQKGGLK